MISEALAYTAHFASGDLRHIDGLLVTLVLDVNARNHLEHDWVQAAMGHRLLDAETYLLDITEKVFIARDFPEHTCAKEIAQEVPHGLPREVLDEDEVGAKWDAPERLKKLVIDFTTRPLPASFSSRKRYPKTSLKTRTRSVQYVTPSSRSQIVSSAAQSATIVGTKSVFRFACRRQMQTDRSPRLVRSTEAPCISIETSFAGSGLEGAESDKAGGW